MTKNKQQTGKEILEWLPNKRWNPFNSYKLLIHVQRWKQINRGEKIPSPALITVDPTNVCNLNCAWCNAEFVRKQRKTLLSEKILLNIADFLPRWGDNNPDFKPGVDAICIAGGGEPLLNPGTANFIDKVIANGVEIGVVTTHWVTLDNFIRLLLFLSKTSDFSRHDHRKKLLIKIKDLTLFSGFLRMRYRSMIHNCIL